MSQGFANVIGIDDAPFERTWRGDVGIVGAVFAGTRLDGVLCGRVRRDGANAAGRIAALVSESPFNAHIQLIMLQGVALAGFNVVDAFRLAEGLDRPVLIVARRAPNRDRIREVLLTQVPGGTRKWVLLDRLGPMELLAGVYVQRVGLTMEQAQATIERHRQQGNIPEPLRVAHLIAGALARGRSRGRA
jgi:endonuclease V-like protein UPF0215 family